MDVPEIADARGGDGGASDAAGAVVVVGFLDSDGAVAVDAGDDTDVAIPADRKSTRLNSSHAR